MATAKKAYTSEYYSFDRGYYIPERQPERVKRTRQRPEAAPDGQEKRGRQEQAAVSAALRILIIAVIAIGILLIGTIVVNAQAAKLQYSINQLRNENNVVQSEIDSLNMKLDGSRSINQLEQYASGELGMYYPQGSECVHLSAVSETDGSLADIIKQKAYE